MSDTWTFLLPIIVVVSVITFFTILDILRIRRWGRELQQFIDLEAAPDHRLLTESSSKQP